MPYYEYECEHGDRLERWYQMGEAPEIVHGDHLTVVGVMPCRCKRVYSFNHVEDRRHMRKGRSPVTGMEYAQSRSEERVIERQLGCEFISPKEMPQKWKHLRDYSQHVKAGGERVEAHEINPEPQESMQGSLLRKAEELGVRLA